MRTIEYTNQFKRDFKRVSKGRYRQALQSIFPGIVKTLADNRELEPKYRDHALSGNLSNHRDCHIKPDLVLIYCKPDEKRLQLIRLGSHSELSL